MQETAALSPDLPMGLWFTVDFDFPEYSRPEIKKAIQVEILYVLFETLFLCF